MTNVSQLRELLMKEILYYYELLGRQADSKEEIAHIKDMCPRLESIDDRELVKELSSAVSRWTTNRFK